jgi:hypothetical protein
VIKRTAFLALLGAAMAFAAPAIPKWPPWISIESPVNPYDPATRGAVLVVHATFREGDSQLSDVSGTAEGLVDGKRRSIPLRFESTGRANQYALKKQWPADGAWLAKINLRTTTAIVTFDAAGKVAGISLPTQIVNGSDVIPRAVTGREVDSTLARMARQ